MSKFRMATIAAGAAMSVAFSSAAFAVSSDSECVSKDGTVMDLQNVKHCLVPVIPEEFQGEEYADNIKGVTECTGTLRKTSIGDFCLIALEAKPAAAAAVTPTAAAIPAAQTSADPVNAAIGEASDAKAEMAAEASDAVDAAEEPKKKGGWFSRN